MPVGLYLSKYSNYLRMLLYYLFLCVSHDSISLDFFLDMLYLLLNGLTKLLEEVYMKIVPFVLPLIQIRYVRVDVSLIKYCITLLHYFCIFIEYYTPIRCSTTPIRFALK